MLLSSHTCLYFRQEILWHVAHVFKQPKKSK